MTIIEHDELFNDDWQVVTILAMLRNAEKVRVSVQEIVHRCEQVIGLSPQDTRNCLGRLLLARLVAVTPNMDAVSLSPEGQLWSRQSKLDDLPPIDEQVEDSNE